jgi:hypothetical protein
MKLTVDIESGINFFKSQFNFLNEKLGDIYSQDETLSLYFSELNIVEKLENIKNDYSNLIKTPSKGERGTFSCKKKMKGFEKYLNNAFTFEYFKKFSILIKDFH